MARADIDLAPRRAVGNDLHLRAVGVLAERLRALRRRFAQIQYLRTLWVVHVSRPRADRAGIAVRAAVGRTHVAQVARRHKARQAAARDLTPAVPLEQDGHARAGFKRTDASIGRRRAAPHIDLAAVSRGNGRGRRALVDQRVVHVAGIGCAAHVHADIIPLIRGIQNVDGHAAGHARHHRVIQRRPLPQIDIAAVCIGHRADASVLREGQVVARHIAGFAIHCAHGIPAGSALPLHRHPRPAVVFAKTAARFAGVLAQIQPAAAHHREIRGQRHRRHKSEQQQQRDQFDCFPHLISPTLLSCAYKTNEHAGFFLFFSFCSK